MTRTEALKHPYIVFMRKCLMNATCSKKAHILRSIELKVDLLTGKLTQEEYNNKLFESLGNAMNSDNFGI